jgi:enoyl-[acyl-carrier protein] reductase / trans-2-enoyl-CoA reductase (NAD+)
MDDWELAPEIQAIVRANWDKVSQENLGSLTDFEGYREAFLNLHGFDIPGVDYELDQDPNVEMGLESI